MVPLASGRGYCSGRGAGGCVAPNLNTFLSPGSDDGFWTGGGVAPLPTRNNDSVGPDDSSHK